MSLLKKSKKQKKYGKRELSGKKRYDSEIDDYEDEYENTMRAMSRMNTMKRSTTRTKNLTNMQRNRNIMKKNITAMT